MQIRPMKPGDVPAVIDMMRGFYASPAVLSDGSEEIFAADAAECTGDSPYAEGFVFEDGGALLGYAMLAKSFSTEFGKRCIWIEDLFLQPQARGKGYAGRFFSFIKARFPDCVFRLEVEKENAAALAAYKKSGFDFLCYDEMIRF